MSKLYKPASEIDHLICEKLAEGDAAEIQFKHYPAIVSLVKSLMLDAVYDSKIQKLLHQE